MKKILSLVLAVAMLSTMAFAAASTTGGNGLTTVDVRPGSDLTVGVLDFKGLPAINEGDFNSDNFRIVKQSFSKGSNLVEKVAFSEDNDEIVITLKANDTLIAPKSNNLIISELSVQAKKIFEDASGTKMSRTTVYKFDTNNVVINKAVTVGYTGTKMPLDTPNLSYPTNDLYEYTEGGDKSVVAIASYDKCTDLYIEGRVYKGDKVFFKANNNPDTNFIKLYENADLRFVNISTNGLTSNNDIQILAEKDEFVYKIVDGKTAPSGLEWSDDEFAWTGKLRTSAKYVISDIELKVSASAGSENPDTGANDVVGVAAALAIVSVVAAAAVSLKK